MDPNTGRRHRIVEVFREDDEDSAASSEKESILPEPLRSPIISCFIGDQTNFSTNHSPLSHDDCIQDKDDLSLTKSLFGCGHFIP